MSLIGTEADGSLTTLFTTYTTFTNIGGVTMVQAIPESTSSAFSSTSSLTSSSFISAAISTNPFRASRISQASSTISGTALTMQTTSALTSYRSTLNAQSAPATTTLPQSGASSTHGGAASTTVMTSLDDPTADNFLVVMMVMIPLGLMGGCTYVFCKLSNLKKFV